MNSETMDSSKHSNLPVPVDGRRSSTLKKLLVLLIIFGLASNVYALIFNYEASLNPAFFTSLFFSIATVDFIILVGTVGLSIAAGVYAYTSRKFSGFRDIKHLRLGGILLALSFIPVYVLNFVIFFLVPLFTSTGILGSLLPEYMLEISNSVFSIIFYVMGLYLVARSITGGPSRIVLKLGIAVMLLNNFLGIFNSTYAILQAEHSISSVPIGIPLVQNLIPNFNSVTVLISLVANVIVLVAILLVKSDSNLGITTSEKDEPEAKENDSVIVVEKEQKS